MRRLIPRIKTTLRALSYRNYRLFFFGQGVSLIGTWMQNIALSWLVYRLTNSIFLLGLVGFLSQIMVFIFAPFSGVIADRLNRYKILLCTQTLAMLQAFVLAFLVLTGRITIWEIMLLGSLLGLINAFDIPARQSFIIKMVEKKEDLGNAIALNSSLVNMARLVGPSIAGLLIAAVGEGFCFLINGVSYIAVLYSLLAMKVKPFEIKKRETHIFSEFKEGLSYAYHFIPIRYILLLLAVVSLLGMPYTILMPVMARDILHGGPQTLGFLMGAAGIGAFCGAIYLASRKNVIGLVGLIALASGIFGVGLMALSFSRSFWISIPLIVIIGFGMMVQMAAGNTILQTVVEEKKRGRVLSLFVMAFMGMSPFGSLLAGTFAGHYGLPATFFYSGLLCLLCAGSFAFVLPEIRKAIRPVYVKMGILPEVTVAIEAVSQLTEVPEE